jgi:hypothetical protein
MGYPCSSADLFLCVRCANAAGLLGRAQIIRIQQIAAEHAYYCEKLEMKAGTPKHNQCLLYLGEFRQKVGNRFADENQFP